MAKPLPATICAVREHRPESRTANVAQHGFVLEADGIGLDQRHVVAVAGRVDIEA